MAKYPASTVLGLATVPEGAFLNDPDHTDLLNATTAELQAIATTLGVDPQKGSSNVAMRLEAFKEALDSQSGRIGDLEGGDVEYFTQGQQSDSAPFRSMGIQLIRSGNAMTFRYNFQRSDNGAVITGGGSDINISTKGDVGDTVVGTLPAQFRGNMTQTQPLVGYGARGVFGHYRSSTGEIVLTNVTGTGKIELGENFYIGGTVMIGTT